jgi:hypothetical protein
MCALLAGRPNKGLVPRNGTCGYRCMKWLPLLRNSALAWHAYCGEAASAPTMLVEMAKTAKQKTFEVACPDCGAMLVIDASSGSLISHTPAPRKRMFEDLETAAKAMREQNERKESLFRQSVEAEKNKEDLFEKKFAEALRKAKDAPEEKPMRVFDLD